MGMIIYCGPSGCGKNAIMAAALATGNLVPLVTYTTRPMRDGEKDGVDYNFVSREEFFELEKQGRIFESRVYHTTVNGVEDDWYYGSPRLGDVMERNYVGILDLDGIRSYIKEYGADVVTPVFIYTDDEIREARAIRRGSFDKSEWDRRFADDAKKFSKEELIKLSQEIGRPLAVINNNGEKPTFSKIGGGV